MATYMELLAQKGALEERLAVMRQNEVAEVVARIQQLMSDYGITVDDIVGKRRRGRPPASAASPVASTKAALPPKYQDPKTGATWSGRGRAPAWLGKNRNKFLIEV